MNFAYHSKTHNSNFLKKKVNYLMNFNIKIVTFIELLLLNHKKTQIFIHSTYKNRNISLRHVI